MVKLPVGPLWTVEGVKRVFQRTVVVSYIPRCVCDVLLETIRVIRLEPPAVGSVFGQWQELDSSH